ncbi:hypothetical protein A3203_26520 [Burkholderia cenocepacia]|nr:hypothetical protein A3203_26520 [Burkholderia cenocepacia]
MAAGAVAPDAGKGAGAAMSPFSRAISDTFQPPPSAFTSPTDDTIRCPAIVASFCCAVNAVVCAVSTFRYATVPALYWFVTIASACSALSTACRCTSISCARMRCDARLSSTSWNAVSTASR